MKVHQSLLNQAKQGDATAIAQLMQAPLVVKGITVQTHLKNGCLHVDLVANPCPPKKASLSFIRKGVAHLHPEGIRAVRIDGYQTGVSEPGWVSRFNLHGSEEDCVTSASTTSQPSGKQGSTLEKRLPLLAGFIGVLLLAGLGVMFYANQPSPSPIEEVVAPTTQP